VANYAALPATGETSKIYVALDLNKIYRWSGSAYVEIAASPGTTDNVPEGTTNKYFSNTLARGALSASTGISYNSSTGAISSTITQGITDVVNDTTPQLGGSLDVNGNAIVSVSNGNIRFEPNGSGNIALSPASGKIILGSLDFPTGTGTNGQVLTTNGTGALSFTTITAGITSGGALGTPSSGNLSNCTADGTNGVGFRSIPSAGAEKSTSYTLQTSDRAEFVQVASGGSITVPNSTFAAGDVVVVYNNHTAAITITLSTTNAYIAGTNTNKTSVSLATRGVCNILFISSTVAILTGNIT
jgi:hypothetical protein